MQQQRASESADEIGLRLVKNSTRKAQKRASDETLYRQEKSMYFAWPNIVFLPSCQASAMQCAEGFGL